jgi:phosphatidylserine decarboxylase
MATPLPLPVWDRKAGRLFQEFMADHPSTYESKPRRSLTQWLESEPLYDWLVAAYQDTARSARNIEPFIKSHDIDMSEFKPVIYRSFADFFDREFRPGVRPFVEAPGAMAAYAEARYFGWEKVEAEQQFPIKGTSLNAEQILGSKERAAPFRGGPVMLGRLSPMDYHHVHYPDDGTTLEKAHLGRSLWTVQWHALQHQPDILLRNERQINILGTRNFGKLAFVEVGAMSVGRIVQVHPLDTPFRRGDEKSVFKFGGSAVIVFGEPGRWRPADDILEHTNGSIETLVRLGDVIASSANGKNRPS